MFAAHLGGRALGERPSLVEHLDAVADLHHERHVVVDQEHARLVVVAHGADDGGELGHLALGQPGGRLVEQQEARLGRERPGDAELPLVAVGEAACRLLARTARARRAPSSASARRRASRGRAPQPSAATSTFSRTLSDANEPQCWNVRARPARPRRCGDHRVTSWPPSSTVPAGREVEPGEDVDERRLARAVRADQADDLVPVELERRRRGARGRPRSGVRRRWPGEHLRATGRSVRSGRGQSLVDLGHRLGLPHAHERLLVVLHLHDPPRTADDAVQLRREGDRPGDRGQGPEALEGLRQLQPVRVTARLLQSRRERVDRRRAEREARRVRDLLRCEQRPPAAC